MAADESPSVSGAEALAQRAADRLALALEEVGFDVGVAFPELHGLLDESGAPTVHLGGITSAVASDLSGFLSDAVGLGLTLPLR
jgi:hypothetical protein